MADKYYITNGNKVISKHTNNDEKITISYDQVEGNVDLAYHFKYSEADSYWQHVLGSSPNWSVQKVASRTSRRNYIITSATAFVGDGGKMSKSINGAKAFRNPAEAEAYIGNHREIKKYMSDPMIVTERLENVAKSAKKTFTKEQLATLGVKVKPVRSMISNNVRTSVYEKSGHMCAICGRPLEYNEMTVDHILPLSRGGENSAENYAAVCEECNKFKGSSTNKELTNRCSSILSLQATKKPTVAYPVIRAFVRGMISEYGGMA